MSREIYRDAELLNPSNKDHGSLTLPGLKEMFNNV